MRKSPKAVSELSELELVERRSKCEAACSVNNADLINAGRGLEKGRETYAKGVACADPLSIEYKRSVDAVQEVIREFDARKRWHGSLKPIKRRAP